MPSESHQSFDVNASPVAVATSFIHRTFSHVVSQRNGLPAEVRRVDDVCCFYCDGSGPGVIDSRPGCAGPICERCWGLLASASSFFPGNKAKVTSIIGLMGMFKANAVFTVDGLFVYVSEQAVAKRAEKSPQDLTQDRLKYVPGGINTILAGISDGLIRPPFVWTAPVANKGKSMRSLRLTTNPRHVIYADRGVVKVYDCLRLGAIHRRLAALPPDVMASKAVRAWLRGDDLLGVASIQTLGRKEAMELRGERERAGIDRLLLSIPEHERTALRVMLAPSLRLARNTCTPRERKES